MLDLILGGRCPARWGSRRTTVRMFDIEVIFAGRGAA
jgi:hypothetical protein